MFSILSNLLYYESNLHAFALVSYQNLSNSHPFLSQDSLSSIISIDKYLFVLSIYYESTLIYLVVSLYLIDTPNNVNNNLDFSQNQHQR